MLARLASKGACDYVEGVSLTDGAEMTGRFRYLLASLRTDRSGAAAMELAILLPILATMLFGLSQVGFLYFTYNSMLNSARTGAREIAFGRDEATVRTAVRNQLPAWAASSASITVTPNIAGVARVQVSVPGSTASLLSLVPMPANIVAEAAMPRVLDS